MVDSLFLGQTFVTLFGPYCCRQNIVLLAFLSKQAHFDQTPLSSRAVTDLNVGNHSPGPQSRSTLFELRLQGALSDGEQ